MAIPSIHRAGTSIEWSYTTPNYTPTDGWASAVHLTPPLSHAPCQAAIRLAAVADGDTWTIDAPASRSEPWPPGEWTLDVEVSKGTDVFVPTQGTLKVGAAPGTTPQALLDLQTNLAATDSAINAILAGGGVQEMMIQTTLGQRQLNYMSLRDLRQHRTWIIGQIGSLKRALGIVARNKNGWRPIRTYLK